MSRVRATLLVFSLVALGCGDAPSAADACGVGVTLDEHFREVDGLGATDGYVVRYWVGEAGQPAPASIEELMVFDREAFRQSDPGEMSAVGTMSLGALTTAAGCVVAADLLTGRSMEGAMLSTVSSVTPWVAVVSWPEDLRSSEAG